MKEKKRGETRNSASTPNDRGFRVTGQRAISRRLPGLVGPPARSGAIIPLLALAGRAGPFPDHRDEDVEAPHQPRGDAVADGGITGDGARLHGAALEDAQAETAVDDAEGDEPAAQPEVGAAPGGAAGSGAAVGGGEDDSAFVVDAVVDPAAEGLDGGQGEEDQADDGVRVRP